MFILLHKISTTFGAAPTFRICVFLMLDKFKLLQFVDHFVNIPFSITIMAPWRINPSIDYWNIAY
jgi:hypothetical protein